jgi:hypothetical protein
MMSGPSLVARLTITYMGAACNAMHGRVLGSKCGREGVQCILLSERIFEGLRFLLPLQERALEQRGLRGEGEARRVTREGASESMYTWGGRGVEGGGGKGMGRSKSSCCGRGQGLLSLLVRLLA